MVHFYCQALKPSRPSLALAGVLAALLLVAGCLSRGPASPPPAPHLSPVPAGPLPGPVSAAMVAVSADGRALAAANPDSGTLTLVELPALRVRAEVPTGIDPRTVAFTPDGAWVMVANHGSGTVTFVEVAGARAAGQVAVGALPYGVVAGHGQAYVSLAGLGEVAVVDLAERRVLAGVPVEPFAAGLALAADGRTLYVTHLYSGRVTVIDTATAAVREVLASAPEANLAQFITLSPDGTRAYLPHTLSHSANTQLTYTSTVEPVVSVLDLSAGAFDPGAQLALASLGRPVNLPIASALSPDAQRLYVANAGTDDVTVIDLAQGKALAHLQVGHNPRGLALAPDGGQLYVVNALDGTLDVFDARGLAHQQTVTLTTLPLPEAVLAGKRLFNSALPPMSRAGWISCASCHLDGGADARTWLGFPDGPRDTPALFGAAQTLPLHWNGNLDELHDSEHTIRGTLFGAGLVEGEPFAPLGPPNAGRSAALDALAAYLAALAAPPSPYAPVGSEAAAAVDRGERAFRRWGCAVCHTPPVYTDRSTHVTGIGAASLERNQSGPLPRFDTPSLLGVWATAPYFHDGSAPTLRDTLFGPGFHGMGYAMDAREVEDLVAFMRALPGAGP